MVSILTTSAVDHGFEPQTGQPRDFEIDICCFSAEHAALRSESKKLVGSESGWCIRGERHGYPRTVISVSKHNKDPSTGKRVSLVQSGHHHHLIKSNLFSPSYSWKLLIWCWTTITRYLKYTYFFQHLWLVWLNT